MAATDRPECELGVLSRTETNLRGRGQLWTESGRVIVDLASVVNVVATTGARYTQPVALSFSAGYTGDAATPLALTEQCHAEGTSVPSEVQYEVEGERLTVGLPTQSFSGLLITPRYVFRRGR